MFNVDAAYALPIYKPETAGTAFMQLSKFILRLIVN